MLQNPATSPHDEPNDFTIKVRQFTSNWSGYHVRLRDGTLVRPQFIPAEDDTCVDCFGIEGYRWNLDGTSVTNPKFDMMEIVR